VLFLALFASQAGVLVMSPILGDVADEFGVSIAEAGQLRILAAPLAAVVALAAGRLLVRLSPRALLASGSTLLATGSLASAAAPTFHVLALAQVPMWAGVALLIAAGVAATAAWSEPAQRTRVVAHALAGPPAAWIVGMPVIGVVAEVDWRLTFLALPLPAALVAGLAVLRRPRDLPLAGARSSLAGLLGRRDARRWALGELLANAAWAGTLVFSGALFTEVHGLSSAATGVVLALIAAVFLAGNQWAGRADPARARRTMLEASVVAAVALVFTWAYAPRAGFTVALFSVAAFFAAARTVSGTVHGFSVAGDLGREVGSIRAATTQLGYLIGSLVGGVALAVGGFEALAVAFGGLLLASTLPYVCVRATCAQIALQPAR
jgi:predicted MFS family arabinose efflux permease